MRQKYIKNKQKKIKKNNVSKKVVKGIFVRYSFFCIQPNHQSMLMYVDKAPCFASCRVR